MVVTICVQRFTFSQILIEHKRVMKQSFSVSFTDRKVKKYIYWHLITLFYSLVQNKVLHNQILECYMKHFT